MITAQGLTEQFIAKIHSDAEDACFHKSDELLTDDQKFALAMLAHVPYTTEVDSNNHLKFVTDPCNISWNGQWWVVTTLSTGVKKNG